MEKTITTKNQTTTTKKAGAAPKKATASTTAKETTKPAAAQVAQPKAVTTPDMKLSIIREQQGSKSIAPVNQQTIALRAYYLWEQEGRQHGRDKEYWLRAEELLKKEEPKK